MTMPAVTPAIEFYCRWVARQYFAPGLETQDLVQEARIGVMKAQRDFDPSRGDWEPFAKLAAKRNVITAVKAATRSKHAVLSHARCYDEPIGGDGETTLADYLPAPIDIAVRYEQRERTCCLLDELSERLSQLEIDVLRHRAAGDDYATISAALGVNAKSIDNALQRVRWKAQRILDAYDEPIAA